MHQPTSWPICKQRRVDFYEMRERTPAEDRVPLETLLVCQDNVGVIRVAKQFAPYVDELDIAGFLAVALVDRVVAGAPGQGIQHFPVMPRAFLLGPREATNSRFGGGGGTAATTPVELLAQPNPRHPRCTEKYKVNILQRFAIIKTAISDPMLRTRLMGSAVLDRAERGASHGGRPDAAWRPAPHKPTSQARRLPGRLQRLPGPMPLCQKW